MIYDCFIFFNELDLLEIRLNELDGVVDKFVLVEANRTFQNTPKPFYFEENKTRYAQFLEKIVHIKITDYPIFLPIINPFSPWKIEFFQRNAVLKGLTNAKSDDVILISDVDEIPNKMVLKNLIENGINQIYGLKMHMFMYFLNNQLIFDEGSNMSVEESENGIWHCTVVAPFGLIKKKPHKLRKIIMRTKRKGEIFKIIPNAGWHFTYIGGVKKIIEKLEAFSHTEYNLKAYKNEDKIQEYIKSGKDLFGRNLKFNIIDDENFLPDYLSKKEVKERFKNLFF